LAEVLFYHLESQSLETVLPSLLEKTLERGWKAVVEVGSEERLAALESHLWTYRDDSFLPHGQQGAGHETRQPILLTTTAENGNGAEVRFFVDRAVPQGADGYTRIVFMFSGHDADAVTEAREAWKRLRDGADVTYWQQDQSGRWSRKA
jgi:DNA polymerase-3 subunit chi